MANFPAAIEAAPLRHCFISLPRNRLSHIKREHSLVVLRLTTSSDAVFMVSWAGACHKSSSSHDFVKLSENFLRSNGLQDGQIVTVQQVATPPPCSYVSAIVDDVEELEDVVLNMAPLQEMVAQQARVVSVGLRLPIWLPGGVCVNIAVAKVSPSPVAVLQPLTSIEFLPPDCKIQHKVSNEISDPLSMLPSVSKYFMKSLMQDMIASIIVKNRRFVANNGLKVKKICQVLSMPSRSVCENQSTCKLFPNIFVSNQLMNGTFLELQTSFLAKLTTVESTKVKKIRKEGEKCTECFDTFYSVVFVWENCVRKMLDFGQCQSCSQALSERLSENCIVIPDSVRRLHQLGAKSNVILESIDTELSSGSFHAKISLVTGSCPDKMLGKLSEVVRRDLIKLCEIGHQSVTIVNNPTLFKVTVDEHSIDVLLTFAQTFPAFTANEKALVSSSFSVNSNDSNVSELISRIPANCVDLDKSSFVDSFAFEFIGEPDLLEGLMNEILKKFNTISFNIYGPSFMLLQGVEGSGKTSLIKTILRRLEADPYLLHCEYFSLKKYINKNLHLILDEMLSAAKRAQSRSPCLLVLDDLDAFCPVVSAEVDARHHTQLVSAVRTLMEATCLINGDSTLQVGKVVVLATCSHRSKVDTNLVSFQQANFFPKLCRMPTLTPRDKVQVLNRILTWLFSRFYRQKKNSWLQECVYQKCANQEQGRPNGSDKKLIIAVKEDILFNVLEGYKLSDLNHLASRTWTLLTRKYSDVTCKKAEEICKERIACETSCTETQTVINSLNDCQIDELSNSRSDAEDKNMTLTRADENSRALTETENWNKTRTEAGQMNNAQSEAEKMNKFEDKYFNISTNDILEAALDYTPLAYKDVMRGPSDARSEVLVGGLSEARQVLHETLCWPALYPKQFSLISGGCMRLVTGILLYGPSGCGKTRLAQYAAQQAGISFVPVKGPELLSKYIGQSEENVRNVFAKAAGCAPSVLFFDEFDALAPRRGTDNSGVTDRVVNQLLTQLDGVESREGVFVMAATTRPDMIDPALLRPGRLEKHVYCGLPSEADRIDILKVLSCSFTTEETIDWGDIAKRTPHMSGADLLSILTTAQLLAVRDLLGEELLYGDTLCRNNENSSFARISLPSQLTNILPGVRMEKVQSYEEFAYETIPELISDTKKLTSSTADYFYDNKICSSKGRPDADLKESRASVVIRREHIERALVGAKPSISPVQRSQYQQMQNTFHTTKQFITSSLKQKTRLA